MAIKFEENDKAEKPADKKQVGGKTYVAEEPSATEQQAPLPFAKPVKTEKKDRKPKR